MHAKRRSMKSKFAKFFFGCTGCSGFVLSYHVLNCENPVRSFFLASFQNSNVSIIPYHIFSNRWTACILYSSIYHKYWNITSKNEIKDEAKGKKKPCWWFWKIWKRRNLYVRKMRINEKRQIVDIQTNPYMFAFLHFLLLSQFQVYPSSRFSPKTTRFVFLLLYSK